MGENVSRGYLRKIVAKASTALDATYGELLARLPLEPALNIDETGHKENAGKFWTWVFHADLYVLFKNSQYRELIKIVALSFCACFLYLTEAQYSRRFVGKKLVAPMLR